MEYKELQTDIGECAKEGMEKTANGVKKGRNRFASTLKEYEKVHIASKNGVKLFGITVRAVKSKFPFKMPRLSEELFKKLGNNCRVTEFRLSRNRNVIIVTEDLECAIRALNINELFGIKVETKAIEDYISSRYIIRNVDVGWTVEDIFEELWEENVACLSVTRFTKQGSMEPVPVILVSELGKRERSSMRIFLCNYRVEPFIEHPAICKRCLCYGHMLTNCKGNVKCAKCGGCHNIDDCDRKEPICFRCGEGHLASSKICNAYRNEIKIYEVAHNKAITVSEARIIVNCPNSSVNSTRVSTPSFQLSKSGVGRQTSDLTSKSEQLAEKVSEILSITAKIENVLRQLCERLDSFRIQQRRYMNELQANINRRDEYMTQLRENRSRG